MNNTPMGSICSCFCVEDNEGYRNPSGSVHRQCICFRFLAQQLMHMYTSIFQREDHSLPSTSLGSVAPTSDDSFFNTFRSSPRPLAYDDPRCSQLHVGSATGYDKPLNNFNEESVPLRTVKNDCRTESTSIASKWSGYNNGISRKSCPENPSIEITGGMTYIFPSSEEEDVCPTCLEEYTPENPRIILQCSHHFHLGCIYEWMERSELCPVCCKVMLFNETN